ncbi:MAG TPA: SCO family protein [Stellaceae bacterium]|nr:SCO family protein [Stellaceae bacterium]
MTPAAKRGLIAVFLGLAVLLGVLAYDFRAFFPNDLLGEQVAPIPIGGDFTLTDQNGVTRHAQDFRGKLMLVYFGYTFCPDACPTALQDMSHAIDLLGAKGDAVQPIFITIDPARDTVAQMKLYASNFHPRLSALTGTPEQVAEAAKAYRVYYAKGQSTGGDDYLMDHTAFIYLMGRDGKYLSHFSPGTTAEQMAAAIGKHL